MAISLGDLVFFCLKVEPTDHCCGITLKLFFLAVQNLSNYWSLKQNAFLLPVFDVIIKHNHFKNEAGS